MNRSNREYVDKAHKRKKALENDRVYMQENQMEPSGENRKRDLLEIDNTLYGLQDIEEALSLYAKNLREALELAQAEIKEIKELSRGMEADRMYALYGIEPKRGESSLMDLLNVIRNPTVTRTPVSMGERASLIEILRVVWSSSFLDAEEIRKMKGKLLQALHLLGYTGNGRNADPEPEEKT